MIKVGQIYKYDKDILFVISGITPTTLYGIFNNGVGNSFIIKNFENIKWKMIAEYPTWQEAVNSKEFNE
jgi:hypothetical protein